MKCNRTPLLDLIPVLEYGSPCSAERFCTSAILLERRADGDRRRMAKQQTEQHRVGGVPRNDRARPSGGGPTTPGQKGPPKPAMPPRRTWLTFFLILIANFILVRVFFPSAGSPVKVPYTLFKQEVANRNVREIYSRGESITGHFIKPVTYPTAPDSASRTKPKALTTFATTLPSFVDPGFETLLIDHGVEISAEPIDDGGNALTTFLFGFGPAILIIGFNVWIF